MKSKANSHEELIECMPSKELASIAQKVTSQTRLSKEEGLYLLTIADEKSLQQLANFARSTRVGDEVLYASTIFIHPTNLCELSCPLCSFYAKPGWDSAWFLTPEQIIEKVKKASLNGINEVHFVGGLWRDCDLEYYRKCFLGIKAIDPSLHIKALTAVEYHFLAKLHNISIEEVFQQMMEWGLESLPGGGAEILVERIRKKIAPQKITSDEYLGIHKIAHKLGLRSNITMLFGQVEECEDVIEHLCKVRELQDETGGLNTFVPLKFHEENNALGKRKKHLKPKDPKRVYAVCRLMLDNITYLKTLWNYLGIDEALEIIDLWGGNDLASTAQDEKIIKMAGGIEVNMTEETMKNLIKKMGRNPKFVHSGAIQCPH